MVCNRVAKAFPYLCSHKKQIMLLTVFLAIAFCAAITLMLLSAVVFIQDKKFFSSAPQEAQAVIRPRTEELFYGARKIGWVLMVISILTIVGVGVVSIWMALSGSAVLVGKK